jgi:energy-coupling factor transport system permease protein
MPVAGSLFQPGSTIIHRLNPLTKLSLALSFALSSLVSNSVLILLTLVFTSIILLALAKALRQAGVVIFKYLFFMLLILFIVQSFWYSGGDSPVWVIGPLKIKEYGFLFAAIISLRLLVILSCFYVMMFSTHPAHLVSTFERSGLSPRIAYLMLSTMQTIGELQGRAQTIMEVQKCRGVEVEGSLATRARAFLPLFGPLIIGAVLNLESRALALELRGFSSTKSRTNLHEITEARWEIWLRYLLAILPFLALGARWL